MTRLANSNSMILEPNTLAEALSSPESAQWIKAMREEYNSLLENGTWELTDLPPQRKPVSCKWTFKLKYNAQGEIDRYKARLVARGFTQRYGIDFTETFSPVAKFDSIQTLPSLVAVNDLHMVQFDVCTAFLHGEIDEELYMTQPPHFEDTSAQVCRLKKSIYGLRQASRVWNRRFNQFLSKHQLRPTDADPCLYVSATTPVILLAIFVDDGLMASQNTSSMPSILDEMDDVLKVRRNEPDTFVRLHITRNRAMRSIFLYQTQYVERLLQKFGYTDLHPVQVPADPNSKLSIAVDHDKATSSSLTFPYKQLLGSVAFSALDTRPDIAFAISSCARFNHCYTQTHCTALKKVLCYLKSTKEYGISFSPSDNVHLLQAYCDADYGHDLDDRKSQSGVVLILNHGPIAWLSRKQPCTASSTTEAKYLGAHVVTKEIIWTRRLLDGLGHLQRGPTPLFSDNQSAIRLIKNPEYHQKTKHIDIQYHVIREHQANGDITVSYVPT